MEPVRDLLRRNKWRPAGPGRLPVQPRLRTAIVTCMDARISVFDLFDLRAGEAHVIRNAGGVATEDVLRSLAISQRKLQTKHIVVVQHTECGMTTFTDEEFAAELESATGRRPLWSADTFASPEEGVRESVRRIRASPFLVDTSDVRGFVVDVVRGSLSEAS